jgi:flagellar motor switch protein FliM
MDSKVLTQAEINALLGAFAEETEGVPASEPAWLSKNIKAYDFRRPDKFSKDHIRALQMLHEAFARLVASSLSAYLRAAIQVHLVSVEQTLYDEYIQQLPNPTMINVISMEPLPGRVILEINLGIAFGLIDRLLGGAGKIMQKAREVTDIELALLQGLTANILTALKESWSNIVDISPKLEDTVFSPQVIQAAMPGDVAILLVFEIKLVGNSGTISVCLPFTVLEPVASKLSTQVWFSGARRNGPESAPTDVKSQLARVSVPISVQLGHIDVTLQELLSLQVGNVVRLDTPIDGEIGILVGDSVKFLGRPGLSRGKLAVQVTREMLEEEVKDLE